jgi:GNAT superfamily N-acetyltransferase
MRVRRADSADIDAVAALRAAWQSSPASESYLAAFTEWFLAEAPSRWWWVATDNDQIVGMVNLKIFDRMPSPERAPAQWGYLANLFVLPDHRGAGIGTALVEALVECAKAEHLVRVVLSPSEQSVPLYRRQGFREASDLLLLSLSDEQ